MYDAQFLSSGALHIPCKTVQRQADTAFGEQISDILKQYIQMTGEETCFRARGLGQQIVDSPYANGIISVKSKR